MNVDGLFDRVDKDFVVFDFIGFCCVDDCFDCLVYYVGIQNNFDFDFWQEVYDIFCVVVEFGMVFLMIEIFDFDY